MKSFIKKYLPNNLLDFSKNIMPSFFYRKISYSQSGEDIIVEFLLDILVNNKPINYCDIGANSPWKISNTAKFYKKNKLNYTGVLVEPDPLLYKYLKLKRPNDIILNKGVSLASSNNEILNFFVFDSKTLNTFSEEEAKKYIQLGYKLTATLDVEVISINYIFENYFKEKELHFLSIDIEGLDYEIISDIEFEKFKPLIICIETISFETSGIAKKDERIIDFLKTKGYHEFAFTGINSIFVLEEKWSNR